MNDLSKVRRILDEQIVSQLVELEGFDYLQALEVYYNSETYRFLNDDERYGLSRLGGVSLAIRVLQEIETV